MCVKRLCSKSAPSPGRRTFSRDLRCLTTRINPGNPVGAIENCPGHGNQAGHSNRRITGYKRPNRRGSLDDDQPLEKILEVALGFMTRVVCVIEQSPMDQTWSQLGCTLSSEEFGHVFELRRVTRSTAQDLVLRSHSTGCGGGYCASVVRVLHVSSGRLYEVFRSDESIETLCSSERTTIRWLANHPADPRLIVARMTRTRGLRQPPVCGKAPPPVTSCQVFRWDPTQLTFRTADTATNAKRCRQP
jgi:hypothetical protein